MSGKRGSNASLNLLEEKVIGNLMDCSKASIEFELKGHRRSHSSGSQGLIISSLYFSSLSLYNDSSSNRSPYRIQCNSSSNRSPYRIQCNSNT